MAFKIGSTNFIGGTNPVLPLPSSAARGAQLMTNGTFGFWSYPGETVGGTIGATFETRTLITHGYQAGGYKGGNPWRSVNKTWHSTDITVYWAVLFGASIALLVLCIICIFVYKNRI
jgi:hypothetical protein